MVTNYTRDFCICETRMGQQVAQLHDRYDDDDDEIIPKIASFLWLCGHNFKNV
jgi:hypothetical protein